jgi:hypothetical protein
MPPDIIELVDEEVVTETVEGEQAEGLGVEAADDAAEDDEVVVTIGEVDPPEEDKQAAPEWVRELRRKNREQEKRIKELQSKLEPEVKASTLGAKPTLRDHEWDEEAYERALEAWHEQKRKVESESRAAEEARQAQQVAWNAKRDKYKTSAAELGVKDFEDATAVTVDTLTVTQQGIILQGAKNSAVVMYALGKNVVKLKELAAVKDPVEFAFAIADLEKELKVTKRKPPSPETVVKAGGGARPSGVDSKLAALEAEADRTGDRSKVIAYKRDLKLKSG